MSIINWHLLFCGLADKKWAILSIRNLSGLRWEIGKIYPCIYKVKLATIGSLHIFPLNFKNLVPIKFIILKDSNHFIVQITLILYPRNNDITKITKRLNHIQPNIDLTYGRENNITWILY